MLNLTELQAKAASNDMTIVAVQDGLYQIYSSNHPLGEPCNIDELQNHDYWGLFDEFEDIAGDEPEPGDNIIKFLCTNASNSSFMLYAPSAEVAIKLAAKRFDSESDYILPINVESECGATGACTGGALSEQVHYTDESLGLNDDI